MRALSHTATSLTSLFSPFSCLESPGTSGARTADRTVQTTAFSPCLRRNDVAGAPNWSEDAALPVLYESAPISDQAFPIWHLPVATGSPTSALPTPLSDLQGRRRAGGVEAHRGRANRRPADPITTIGGSF